MKLDNRADKINFLKKLLNKESKVSDLYDNPLICFVNNDEEPEIYKCTQTQERFTKTQVDEYCNKYPWKSYLMIYLGQHEVEKDPNAIDYSLNFGR